MTVQTVTFDISRRTYEQIKRAAEKKHRAVTDVLAEAVTAVAPVIDTDSIDLQTALAQLAYLNDAALWQAARTAMSVEQRDRLAWLQDKRQRDGLAQEEQSEEKALLKLYRETMLIRAQAAVLLGREIMTFLIPANFIPLIELDPYE